MAARHSTPDIDEWKNTLHFKKVSQIMANPAEHTASLLPAIHLPGLTAEQSLVVEFTWLAMILIIGTLVFVISNWKKVPGGLQNIVELLTSFIEDYIVDIMGPKGLPYFPLVMTVLLFVGVGNYVGLLPGSVSPTGNLSTTAAWALIVFVFYESVGVLRHGIKYFKHFFGPIPIMAPMMFVMEIISELARPFSLAVRLFANIMGGEMIIKLLFSFCVIGLPVVWMLWDSTITMLIQTFIFSLLTMVYLGGALAADDEH